MKLLEETPPKAPPLVHDNIYMYPYSYPSVLSAHTIITILLCMNQFT